jgi:cbb3-type cytochrome oxidase cytochrome c subunit
MKSGPLVFLGGLIAMTACWCALVVAPVLGLGSLTPHVDGNTATVYPVDRSGTAKQGAEVYRALGCGECHTRHTTQDTLKFGASLTKVNSNRAVVVQALLKIRTDWDAKMASDRLGDEQPIQVLENVSAFSAERAVELLKRTDSKAELTVHNSGDDLRRGWGERHSVSRDYIYDSRVLLGSRRIGPDLANIGSRSPEMHVSKWAFASNETNLVERLEERKKWHLRRLYNPTIYGSNARCPSYQFLFTEAVNPQPETRHMVELPENFSPAGAGAVIAKPAALVLVDWLLSQKADVSLPEAPTSKQAPGKPANSVITEVDATNDTGK